MSAARVNTAVSNLLRHHLRPEIVTFLITISRCCRRDALCNSARAKPLAKESVSSWHKLHWHQLVWFWPCQPRHGRSKKVKNEPECRDRSARAAAVIGSVCDRRCRVQRRTHGCAECGSRHRMVLQECSMVHMVHPWCRRFPMADQAFDTMCTIDTIIFMLTRVRAATVWRP